MTTTITEALAELKTLKARMAKKRENVMRYFARDSRMRDPLEGEVVGGSVEYVRRERQALADLEEQFVRIRSAIQAQNLATLLTLHGVTRSITAWLNWRRDVAGDAKGFLSQMVGALNNVRQQAKNQGLQVATTETAGVPEIIVSVSEQALASEVEAIETLLGDLDGKLSLLNATTTVEY